MTEALVEQLAAALRDTGRLVAGIGPQQWSEPTPCEKWDVRAVVGHLVAGNLMAAAAVAGDGASGTGSPAGADPVAAYQQSSEAVVAAFGEPGALDRVVQVPVGTVPATVALHLRIVEALVHGWDLARATGQPASSDEALADQELAFTRESLRIVPPERTPFRPPQPAPDGAPALDRLAALLGRPVGRPVQ